jgi:GT2 family glycosyltransferase/glycosyltransferase involved in cell wall biosynthesis
MGFQRIVISTVERFFPTGSKRRDRINIIGKPVVRLLGFSMLELASSKDRSKLYKAWISKNEPRAKTLEAQRSERFEFEPKISVIVTVTETPVPLLEALLASVLTQTYSNWELCLSYDSTDEKVEQALNVYAAHDSRVKLIGLKETTDRAEALNRALSAATGEFILFSGSVYTLAPFALYEVVKLLNEKSESDLIYSDEDRVAADNRRCDPSFKPDWSPDYFMSCNYLGSSTVRRSIVDGVGGFKSGFGMAAEYDLLLRVTEQTEKIVHIPKILWHKREGVTAKDNEEKKALEEAVRRRGINAQVLNTAYKGFFRIKYNIDGAKKVSIIIPTKDNVEVLKKCITSVLQKSTYSNYEVIIVDNRSSEKETFAYYKELEKESRVRVIKYDKPFNFSKINNHAVEHSTGEYLLFLNNDTEVVSPGWIEAMIEYAQRESTGVVGAKLFFPNDTIQHAGVIIGICGMSGHSHRFHPKDLPGYGGRLIVAQNLSAVTAACMMIRREVFDKVNGYDEEFAVSFNDVALCVQIRDAGYLIVYTPFAELYHHECLSRGYSDTIEKKEKGDQEYALFIRKWGHLFQSGDPYYNPNLSLKSEDFSVEEVVSPEPVDVEPASYTTLKLRSVLFDFIRLLARNAAAVLKPLFENNRTVMNLLLKINDRVLASTTLGVVLGLPAGVAEKIYESIKETDNISGQPGVNVAGYITSESGVGEAVRADIRAIKEAGIPFSMTNLTSSSRQEDFTYTGFTDDNPYAFNLIHVNADAVATFYDTNGIEYFLNRYNIGFWYWELSTLPVIWHVNFKCFNEIWVASEFCLDSISKVSPVPVVKIPPSVVVEDIKEVERVYFGLDDKSFIFFFMFDFLSHYERKNPLAIIRAFKKAFGTGIEALLVVKCSNSKRNVKDRDRFLKEAEGLNIKFVDKYLDKDELNALISLSDCYVSLHRSEGFGLPIAESMYMGKPVIATGYSGNMEFMNESNSFPVKYTLIEIDKDHGPYKKGNVWADPDLEHAAELMRTVYEDREYAERIGKKASHDIKTKLSPEATGRMIKSRLRKIAEEVGLFGGTFL